jgi:hypothetical protein
MYDIYSNASKVLVWLGEADEDIVDAMESGCIRGPISFAGKMNLPGYK